MTQSETPGEPPLDLTGRTIADFAVLRKIGQGGMGQVYLARQQSLKREVALKILRKDLAANTTALQRFQAEAEAVAKISHPNIVQVYAVGVQDGLNYMALEYVNGRNLREHLERKGPPELPIAITILRQVAAALQRAGELGLVHRDIKPENILLTKKVEVKVTDFGLSCYFAGDPKAVSITQSGMTLGTPLYMSPEQVQGKPVDHRSDLYSFGITAYHLLAGHPPYSGQNAFDVAVQHVQAAPEPLGQIRPDLPRELCALVMTLMNKKPEDRYATARDVARDLARIQKLNATVPSTVALPPRPYQLKFSGTTGERLSAASSVGIPVHSAGAGRWPWRVLGLAGLAAAGIFGWFLFDRSHSAAAVDEAVAIVGLPESRSPVSIVSSRETELREKYRAKPVSPASVRAGMDLGVLLVQDHRLDDADAVFAELEVGKVAAPGPLSAVGKFGRGIVLAHRDTPAESDKYFDEALAIVKPNALNRHIIEKFFFDHRDFGMAISEALNRNADNLAVANQKLPAALEWMRTPAGLLRIKNGK